MTNRVIYALQKCPTFTGYPEHVLNESARRAVRSADALNRGAFQESSHIQVEEDLAVDRRPFRGVEVASRPGEDCLELPGVRSQQPNQNSHRNLEERLLGEATARGAQNVQLPTVEPHAG